MAFNALTTVSVKNNQIGLVAGLAWTQVGGDLLTIETTSVPGKGKMTSGFVSDVVKVLRRYDGGEVAESYANDDF